MKIKAVLVEMDQKVQRDLEDMLQFYKCFDIVEKFDDINKAGDYLYCHDVDAVFINEKTGNAEYSGDGGFLAINISHV